MLDLHSRRLDRAHRKAVHDAGERCLPLSELPSPRTLLNEAEARSGQDRYALAGIGREASNRVLKAALREAALQC